MSGINYEQRRAIKLHNQVCVKLGHSASETFTKLTKPYGDKALSGAHVFKWFKAFSNGRESVKDGSIVNTWIPVSYTHLDVYKRQLLRPCQL